MSSRSANGAHFTTCTPTYERDEKFQKAYTDSEDARDWTASTTASASCPGAARTTRTQLARWPGERHRAASAGAEYCAIAIADCFADDGEIIGSPMGLLPSLGARLAKLTSNPLLMLTDGEARILRGHPPGRDPDVGRGLRMPFRLVLEAVVPYGKRHVMMGATQIDREGNQNISAMATGPSRSARCSACAEPPGNTVNDKTSVSVPKRSARVFVEQVDVVSGVGRTRAEGAGPAATGSTAYTGWSATSAYSTSAV